MKDFFKHFFLPQESNNHRPKLLHHQTLILFIAVIFSFSLLLPTFKESFPQVLGTSINIAVSDLLDLTNKKRLEQGLPALVLDDQLTQAAKMKAKDMFAKNYWAHYAPDGITPWFFIKNSGYKYQYAGENLARGFIDSKDVINAWMASPNHKENMLSSNYKEIGFAMEKGKFNGEETILVVEMLGGKGSPEIARGIPEQQTLLRSPSRLVASIKTQPMVNSNGFARNSSLFIVLLFIMVLISDIIIVEKKRIIRLAGHNFDHILFLSIILLFVLVLSRGVIL